jgi:hypothetical protein
VLYSAGFALQLLGGGLVAWEIREDLRAVRKATTDAGWERVGGESRMFPASMVERWTRRLWRRVAGLVLVFAGAAVGLVANLLALSGT